MYKYHILVERELTGISFNLYQAKYYLEEWEWRSTTPLFDRCLNLLHQLINKRVGDNKIIMISWGFDSIFVRVLLTIARNTIVKFFLKYFFPNSTNHQKSLKIHIIKKHLESQILMRALFDRFMITWRD